MMQQGSLEWFEARLGKVTASRIGDLATRTRTGWAASRAAYLNQLVGERLTGVSADAYVSPAMQWGIEHEAEARRAYQFRQDVEVSEVGFIEHPLLSMSGASPDGYVVADGLVEIKCPNTATHIGCLIDNAVPDRHQLQMLRQLACTGRNWCDYVSYDPRLPEALRLWVQRVDRDDTRVGELEAMVAEFLEEVDAISRFLHQRYQQRRVA